MSESKQPTIHQYNESMIKSIPKSLKFDPCTELISGCSFVFI